jgi:uncharacterized protein (TIGR02118 family)
MEAQRLRRQQAVFMYDCHFYELNSEHGTTMIKVSVMYPQTLDARFDHEYYRDKHMPLIKQLMGDSCLSYTIDRGLSGAAPDTAAPYVAMCHIFSESLEAFHTGFGPHAEAIRADITNYTDITPIRQISEVVVSG